MNFPSESHGNKIEIIEGKPCCSCSLYMKLSYPEDTSKDGSNAFLLASVRVVYNYLLKDERLKMFNYNNLHLCLLFDNGFYSNKSLAEV